MPLLLMLLAPVFIAAADSGSDLAAAKQAFETIKRAVTDEVNDLETRRRSAIWENYYRALEQLQRMDIHHQMMTNHQLDRRAQFEQALAEFNRALADLEPLLHREAKP